VLQITVSQFDRGSKDRAKSGVVNRVDSHLLLRNCHPGRSEGTWGLCAKSLEESTSKKPPGSLAAPGRTIPGSWTIHYRLPTLFCFTLHITNPNPKEFMRTLSIVCIVSVLFFSACKQRDAERTSRNIHPDQVYFDYKISGSQESENVVVMLQFRLKGSQGPTLLLDTPSEVKIDGMPIHGDSTRMTGPYYEIIFQANGFEGVHTIEYTNIDGNKFSEDFDYLPMMINGLADSSINQDEDLVLDIDGLDSVDYVRIVLTDTSRFNEGINRLDTIRNRRLTIAREDLEELSPGPLQLLLTREYERPVKNGSKRGGKIAITYEIRKELYLE
jgi:hypothetical protein